MTVILLLGLGFACFDSASSFSTSKIHPSRDFPIQQVKTDSEEEIESLCHIVDQEFSFYLEDADAYLFLSEDGEHILKFFKMRKITPKYWLNHIPVPWLHKKRLSKVVDRERIRQEMMGTLSAIYEQFRYQTGLVYLHLFKTDYLKTKVTLIDQNGKKRKVSLDEVPFDLRKRAVLVPDYLDKCLANGEEREAVTFLCSILDFVKRGCKLGFAGYSDKIDMDFGLLDGRLVYLSLSHIEKDDTYKTARSTLIEVFRISRSLDSWLQNRYPSLAQAVQDETQDLLSFLEEG